MGKESQPAANNKGKQYLNPTQAAAYLSISRSLLYKMIEARQIAHYRPGLNQSRGKILLAVKDLDEFMEGFRVETMPEMR